jgi:hypothetical protein
MEPEVRTRKQYWRSLESKEADVTGTNVMPYQSKKPSSTDIPVKTAESTLTNFILTGKESKPPEGVDMEGVPGKQPESNPQAKQLNPRVNVTGKEATKEAKVKKASRLALPSMGKYPLDSWTDVEKAAAYFEKWASQLTPKQRHEFCVNLSTRADELGIKVAHAVNKYGSTTYAPQHEIDQALDVRKLLIPESYKAGLDKLARMRPKLSAGVFSEALAQFDKLAGLEHLYDKSVPDPFLSTYGVKVAEGEGISFVSGNDSVSEEQLHSLGSAACSSLHKLYGEDFVKEFRKDPVGIFNSLPVEQKKLLSRMANEVNIG